jgi:hypothetical protein
MEERAVLGSGQVGADELVSVILASLEESPYFPPQAAPRGSGQIAYEGHHLERLEGRVRLHRLRNHPIMLHVVVHHSWTDYADATTAVRAYLLAEHPKGIDGIPVEWS